MQQRKIDLNTKLLLAEAPTPGASAMTENSFQLASGRRAYSHPNRGVNLRLAFLAKAPRCMDRDMFSHERDSGGNHRPPVLGLPR